MEEKLPIANPNIPNPPSVVNLGGTANLPAINRVPNLQNGINGNTGELTIDDIFTRKYQENSNSAIPEPISLADREYSSRYPFVFRGSNPEEMYAQQQSSWDKAVNGTLKGVNIVGTTFAGTLGSLLYGVPKALGDGRFSSIFDNEYSRTLDEWNKQIEDSLPNYYTQAETDSEWYSPTNWMTMNFAFDKVIKNLGFAVGAMRSGNLANAAIGSAGRGIGAATSRLATSESFKLFSPILRSTSRVFSQGKNLEAVAIMKSRLNSIADLTQRKVALDALAKTANEFSKWNDLARRTVIATYSSSGEASFEALQAITEYRDKLIQEYIDINGKPPSGEDLANIESRAESVGKSSYFGNMALLGLTEFHQLPYLLGSSYKKSRWASNTFARSGDDIIIKEGKYAIADVAKPTTRFGKLLNNTKKFVSPYLKGSGFEAGQEIGQYAVSVGTEHYFDTLNNGPADMVDSMLYGLFGTDEEGEGVGALVSKEGLEGGLIGAIIGGPSSGVGVASEVRRTKKNTEKFLEALNNSPNAKKAFMDRVNYSARGIASMDKYNEAVQQDEKLEALDSKQDALFSYLMPRIKYGRTDMVMQDLEELRNQANTEEAIASLKEQGVANIDDTVQTFSQRINDMINDTKSFVELYDYINLSLGGITIEKDGQKVNKYSEQAIEGMTYAAMKVANYDKRILELSPSLLSKNINFAPAVQEAILNNGTPGEQTEALLKQIDEVGAIDKDETLRNLFDVMEMSVRRDKFLKEYQTIKETPETFQPKKQAIKEPSDDESEDADLIKVNTKKGEQILSIGEQYFLNKITTLSKDGKPVYTAPIVTIVGVNEDGTIKVAGPDGVEYDVPKQVFEEYSFARLSTVQNDKKVAFVHKNWNVEFEHRGIKINGKPARGRLSYSDVADTLNFTYVDGKGNLRTVPIKNVDLNPQEGYSKAKVYPIRTLTPAQQLSLEEVFKLKENPASLIKTASDMRVERLSEIYNNSKDRIDVITKEIETTKSKLQTISDQIEKETSFTKDGKPRKRILPQTRRIIDALTSQYQKTEQHLSELEDELSHLEAIVPYFQGIIDQISEIEDEETPTKEIINLLKKDVETLDSLIEATRNEVETSKSILQKIEKLLNDALDLLSEYVKRLREENPNIPMFISEYEDRLEKYLGEQGAKDVITNREGFTNQTLQFEQDINDFSDELKIPAIERKVEKIKNNIDALNSILDEAIKEQMAKVEIISYLERIQRHQESQEALQEKLTDNKFKNKILKTKDSKTIQTANSEGYEPSMKKPTAVVPTSTTTFGDAPHVIRSSNFGARLYSFPNRKNIKGVIVTHKTQSKITPNITSLITQHAKSQGNEINPKEIILLVATHVNPKTGAIDLVDEFGNIIPPKNERESDAQYQQRIFDSAIWQPFPLDGLQWMQYGEDSMFRDEVSDYEREQIKERYSNWRKTTLSEKSLKPPFDFDASFGHIQREQFLNDEGIPQNNYSVRNPVTQTGFGIDEDTLKETQIVTIPKTGNTSVKGGIVYEKPQGIPFLDLPNGLVKLDNRKLTPQEASAVFDGIYAYCNHVFNGTQEEPEARRILQYLKSTVYWGIPRTQSGEEKAPSHNSVFFTTLQEEMGRLVLRIGKDNLFNFVPYALERNKEAIIATLHDLYNNVNSTMLAQINEPYEQITSINPSTGEIKSITWPNYQTFLLSANTPNGEPRIKEHIPLTTSARRTTSPEDVNRTRIYFHVPSRVSEFEIQPEKKVAPKKAAKPFKETKEKEDVVETPVKKQEAKPTSNGDGSAKQKALSRNEELKQGFQMEFPESEVTVYDETSAFINTLKIADEGEYVANGETFNLFTSPSNKMILFTVNPGATLDTVEENVKVIKRLDYPEVFASLRSKMNIEDDALVSKSLKQILFKHFEKHVSSEPSTPSNDYTSETAETETLQEDEGPLNLRDLSSIANEEDEEEAWSLVRETAPISRENWEEVNKWLKINLPQVPVERLQNILHTSNGRKAWGVFRNKAIQVYEGAIEGTTYHEAFHAVWRMFTSTEERTTIVNEVRNKEGMFVTYLGEEIPFHSATDMEIEEYLADEFSKYIRSSSPSRSLLGRIFSALVNFIKRLFIGEQSQSLVDNLFQQINTGGFSSAIISSDPVEGEASSIFDNELTEGDRNEIVQQMVYETLVKLAKDNKSLFDVGSSVINRAYIQNDLLSKIVGMMEKQRDVIIRKIETTTNAQRIETMQRGVDNINLNIEKVKDEFPMLVQKFEEKMLSYSITFDENDHAQYNDEDRVKESDRYDDSQIDHFKKAHGAIKLLLSTIPQYNEGKLVRTSIGGIKLLPLSQVFITLMNDLHTATSLEDMLLKLKNIALSDPSYALLYKRLTKIPADGLQGVSLSEIKDSHEARLLTAFYKVFKKQNPNISNLYILANGEPFVQDGNTASSANQIKSSWSNAMNIKLRKGSLFFKHDERKGQYITNANRIASYKLNSPKESAAFLKELGIDFPQDEISVLSDNHSTQFYNILKNIQSSLTKLEPFKFMSGRALNIEGRLFQLASLRALSQRGIFNNTYYNLEGKMAQTFINPNAPSELYNILSSIESLSEEHLAGTGYEYLLTDVFSQGSSIMARKFGSKNQHLSSGEDLLKPVIVGGIEDNTRGKRTPAAKLSFRDRMILEFNENLKGNFFNLIPGDASMEHALHMGTPITEDQLAKGWDGVHEIFRNYFISEVNLARDGRKVVKGRKSDDLRFFSVFLDNSLQTKIKKSKAASDAIYDAHKTEIQSQLEEFIKLKTAQYKQLLQSYNIYSETSGEASLDKIDVKAAPIATVNNILTARQINYMIANIEMHKLLYSDPYQYADAMKRIKSFLSPRQALLPATEESNNMLNSVYNAKFEKGDLGWTNFQTTGFRTVAYNDVQASVDLEGYNESPYDETDGSGIISLKAHRHMKIRASEWTDANERQYLYEVAWEKQDKGMPLNERDEQALELGNPQVKSTLTSSKPITSGNTNTEDFNNIILDKYALYPLSYRVAKTLNPDSNLVKLYNKMQDENIDYIVFDSGRKVNSSPSVNIYDGDGNFNQSKFNSDEVVDVPFSIMGIQSEVPSKENAKTTRGSQVTKLVTLDLMDMGVPVDAFPEITNQQERLDKWNSITSQEERYKTSPLYEEMYKNREYLEEMMDIGFNNILTTLGIKQEGSSFVIEDFSDAAATLRNELFKRETNDNISGALNAFLEGKAVLESTPAYQQIRNILYSIVDREITSPKITGGMKVQIPSTLLESQRVKKMKTKSGKEAYVSDSLAFYQDEDGKRVCEIMIGRWFDSTKSDEEILNYLNNTPEGQAILEGVAFRIPTQKQNSIDAFRIKKFLPKEFGDNVIVPSALVKKVGSDFDIDKLSLYLKNVIVGKDGYPSLIKFRGFGTVDQFKQEYINEIQADIDNLSDKILTIEDLRDISFQIASGSASNPLIAKWVPIFKEWFDDFDNDTLTQEDVTNIFVNKLNKLNKRLDKLSMKSLSEAMIDEVANKRYKASVENAYIQSMQNLITHPLNFKRLIQPNSADLLKGIATKIYKKLHGGQTYDYVSLENIMDVGRMSRLRQAFITGKYAIGIAAVNQTFHSLSQRGLIYLDPSRISLMNPKDKSYIRNARISFTGKNTVAVNGALRVHMSGITTSDGVDISDINGQFIDGYVDISKGPWIMQLGATPTTASTWMMLVRMGVPIENVAYFMNQPLIREFLTTIENRGSKYLFNDSIIDSIREDILNQTKTTDSQFDGELATFNIPSKDSLWSTIDTSLADMTKVQKLNQLKMLYEFLKFAKLSEQLFYVNQGTNFDTANMNDPMLIFKKTVQMARAKNTMFANVDQILDNSFVGALPNILDEVRDSFSPILLSDRGEVRTTLENVLLPYTLNTPDVTFLKIARKAVSDLFDYVVQTSDKTNLNKMIANIMYKQGGLASSVYMKITEIKANKSHPLNSNFVIQNIEMAPSQRLTRKAPFNLKLKKNGGDLFDQNATIYAFRELKEFDKNLYDTILTLSILQSGTSPSPISFTSLLPYEDVQTIYNPIIFELTQTNGDKSALYNFLNLNVFQRNNWNNSDIVDSDRASLIKTYEGPVYNPSMEFLPSHVKEKIKDNTIPKLLSRFETYPEEFINFTWDKQSDVLTEKEKKDAISKGDLWGAISRKKEEMRKKGDWSFSNRGLFQEVKNEDGTPFTYVSKNKRYKVYKLINAWGDSYRANEFYSTDRPSVLDNGMMQVGSEILTTADKDIISIFRGEMPDIQPREITTLTKDDIDNLPPCIIS